MKPYPHAARIRNRIHRLVRTLIIAAPILVCVPGWAAPGNTAWTSVYAPGGEPDSASAMTISGTTAYAEISGPYNGEPSSDADIHLRAFDIPTGTVLWQDDWAPSGIDDRVWDITASGGRVFIAGAVGERISEYNAYDWAVRAYAGSSGKVLWEDRCPLGSARRVIATPRWVYVAGACVTGTLSMVRVRAYAAATGKLRWETKIPAMSWVFAITLSDDKLVVAGSDYSTGQSLLVRAYGVTRGNLLWQRIPQTPQGAFVGVRSACLAADSRVAYVAWSANNGQAAVVAYYTSTGRLRWQSYVNDSITALTLAPQGWLYVAKAGGESMVSAYDASSGLLRWQDHPGTPAAPFRASALAVGGNQVFVGGNALHPLHESNTNFLVRAYTLGGKLLWADDVPTQDSGGGGNVEGIGWSDGFTVTSGTSFYPPPPQLYLFWQTQAYSAPSVRASSPRAELELP